MPNMVMNMVMTTVMAMIMTTVMAMTMTTAMDTTIVMGTTTTMDMTNLHKNRNLKMPSRTQPMPSLNTMKVMSKNSWMQFMTRSLKKRRRISNKPRRVLTSSRSLLKRHGTKLPGVLMKS